MQPLCPPSPYLASSDDLLGCVHGLATAGATISSSHLLGHPGCVGVGGSVGLTPVGGRESRSEKQDRAGKNYRIPNPSPVYKGISGTMC